MNWLLTGLSTSPVDIYIIFHRNKLMTIIMHIVRLEFGLGHRLFGKQGRLQCQA